MTVHDGTDPFAVADAVVDAHDAESLSHGNTGRRMPELVTVALRRIAMTAGAEILAIYKRDFAVREKADASPVTEADEAAERLIVRELAMLSPDIPIVAEESFAAGNAPTALGNRFWLVDPLDGTKEFINRNGEFTVNIALVEGGRPVMGVVYAPAIGRMFCGTVGVGATAQQVDADGDLGEASPIAVRRPAADGLVVVASRSHRDAKTDEYLAQYTVKQLTSAGSSLKFCLVAAGEADLYPRLGRTMEWDTAAGHAILAAAGGTVETLDGKPLGYGKPGLDNPHFVACGGPGAHPSTGSG